VWKLDDPAVLAAERADKAAAAAEAARRKVALALDKKARVRCACWCVRACVRVCVGGGGWRRACVRACVRGHTWCVAAGC
jgi:hypothetical protein